MFFYRFVFFSLCLIFTSTGFLQSEENPKFKKFINFDHQGEEGAPLQTEDFRTYAELSTWAIHNGLQLVRDRSDFAPGAGTGKLQNGLCRMIPEDGLRFYLTADPSRNEPLYVQMDLTQFTYTERPKGLKPRDLRIFVNGVLKSTVVFPGNSSTYSSQFPVRFRVDPGELIEGRLDFFLVPNAGELGRFWGIWDVFYHYHAPESK
ncbi:LIC10729 family protein [Leptospira stimsonii]|uniref:Uncharacterized protein n=1 Tax=Leptospira stimsonii TaxID=2202203 RepID=A0A4R9L785_9LEPT|nr:hypothetical protein [Leptospira stimsonii]RHX88353.1 hypothetical protein DLM78_05260 [Leptospira stimsonii]TGK22161.1 hypothetical protein EHO98_07700 [Leptospira stimsonii]TGM17182.1 hypothetical protein EHQ90_07885 [Leptospira stimsonii]